MYQTRNRENSEEKSKRISKDLHYNIKDYDYPSYHQRSTSKESQGDTTVPRFLSGIWFSQRNCYRYIWFIINIKIKLDGKSTRMLCAALNNSWKQHPTKQQLYGHLPPISQTIQVQRTRHGDYCWRSKDELVSDVFSWTSEHGRVRVGRLAKTYYYQHCVVTGYNLEDLSRVMDDGDGWWKRVMEPRVVSVAWTMKDFVVNDP